jgi:hypothetical protein
MKGDFSDLDFDPSDNYTGVLYQQGRVFLDADGTAEALIEDHLRTTLAQDVIGAHVAAVPAAEADSLKVVQAVANGGDVRVAVKPGRVWVDGVPLLVPGVADVVLTAPYLAALFHSTPPDPIGAGVRDAVILEVWQEAFNAFQDPNHLIEPALGGVDTTERMKVSFGLKLLRLGAGEGCANLATRLADDFAAKGKLTVTPSSTMTITGDCPVELGGGYTGFEHFLYRIEIAEPDRAGNARFKWSQWNGGLVGRGEFAATGATGTVRIKANNQMINHCGVSSFYLEALAFDATVGHWRVVFSAAATLSQDDTLTLTSMSGTWPAVAPATAFFRLWNGIEPLADYAPPAAGSDPTELKDGVRLAFDTPATAARYSPGDYWTFPVRASGAAIDAAWIQANWPSNAPPAGVRYRRAPLAVLTWPSAVPVKISDTQIEDCRRVFDPLTDLRGCCIDVKPGDDLHRAVQKLIDAGGGCLCLLPGNHVLTRPIDLTRRNSIRIRGFGSASRLLIGTQMQTSAFVLAGANDIGFESFVAINGGAGPLWECRDTVRLRVRDVFALTNLQARSPAVVTVQGRCHGWRLEDNLFFGASGLTGELLASSAIVGNVWLGARRGIDLLYGYELNLERNDFVGIAAEQLADLGKQLDAIVNGGATLSSPKAFSFGIAYARGAAIAPAYVGVELHAALDTDIVDNEFFAAAGLLLEWIENGLVQRNRFRTRVAGLICGIAHGLRFADNRIGVAAGDPTGQPQPCDTGLAIRSEAVECRIVDNVFANVKNGVVFETDFDGHKAVVRDFSANLLAGGAATDAAAKELLGAAVGRTQEVAAKNLLLSAAIFRLGRTERVTIERNQLHATAVGIEWSGTMQIFDFRIVGNAFIGCQDVAIQIEPDSGMLLLADPVETKARLIANNRFEIFSGAVRATIGAVRVEQNEIRVAPPIIKVLPPRDILVVATTHLYNSATLAKAVDAEDTPLVGMVAMAATTALEDSPNTVNAAAFAKNVAAKILSTYAPNKGDMLADDAFALKTLAAVDAKVHLGVLSNALFPKWVFNNEGFVVNLAGVQNRVAANRLYSTNTQRPGGVLLNAVSGDVRDNEVVVPGTALQLNGKLGLDAKMQDAQITGNSLVATGIPGAKTAVYALAIPSMSAGYLAINNNAFKGSVMIGGDPLSAQGFNKPNVFTFPQSFTLYNAMKMDMSTYAKATLSKAFPLTFGSFGALQPPLLVFPFWLADPHAGRPVVHFCQNRIVQGWVGVFQALSGAYWSAALLRSKASQALVANIGNNVIDYGGSVVGHDVAITGNCSQAPLKYRVGGTVQAVANIPAAQGF